LDNGAGPFFTFTKDPKSSAQELKFVDVYGLENVSTVVLVVNDGPATPLIAGIIVDIVVSYV
jgi:hypothetical protein